MTISMKSKSLFFLKVDLCRNLSKGKPIHFAEKYKSTWHLGRGAFCHFTFRGTETARCLLHWFSSALHWCQKIIWAILRLLRVTPYCPWGKDIGNPTADIQSVRKSSWLCLQNTFRFPSLSITSSEGTPRHCLVSEYFTSFPIGLLVPCPLATPPGNSPYSSQDEALKHVPPLKVTLGDCCLTLHLAI